MTSNDYIFQESYIEPSLCIRGEDDAVWVANVRIWAEFILCFLPEIRKSKFHCASSRGIWEKVIKCGKKLRLMFSFLIKSDDSVNLQCCLTLTQRKKRWLVRWFSFPSQSCAYCSRSVTDFPKGYSRLALRGKSQKSQALIDIVMTLLLPTKLWGILWERMKL